MTDTETCFVWYDLVIDGAISDDLGARCTEDHGVLHPFFKGEQVFFECLACSYKMYPGSITIEKMRFAVAEALSTNGFVR